MSDISTETDVFTTNHSTENPAPTTETTTHKVKAPARVQIRQGDVLLLPIRRPRKLDRVSGPDGQPLAGWRLESERTGHVHAINCRVYTGTKDRVVLFLERPATLTHPEHLHVEVPAGWWELRQQREIAGFVQRRYD